MFFAMDAARAFAVHTVLPWTTHAGLLPYPSFHSPLRYAFPVHFREFFL